VGQQLTALRLPYFCRKSEALPLPEFGLVFTKGHLIATLFMGVSVQCSNYVFNKNILQNQETVTIILLGLRTSYDGEYETRHKQR